MAATRRVLFICPYPQGESPSQRFRFEQYFEILAANNFSYTHASFLDRRTWQIIYRKGHYLEKVWGVVKGFARRFALLFQIPRYDFIFVHREAAPIGPPVFEFILSKLLGKKMIYDFDDAIWLANTSSENKVAALLKWHSKVAAICRWSYKVSCGNEYLCSYARRYNDAVVFIPTTIDTDRVHVPKSVVRQENQIVIGWTGTHSTLKYLDPLIPAFQRLFERNPGRLVFSVIADKDPSLPIEAFRFVRWTKSTEIDDLQTFDIGVMPLTNDPWSDGKCGFKALQYMALEIPTVASPVGVNTTIIHHGQNGFLADGTDEWVDLIGKLIDDFRLRKRIGANARHDVIARYSVAAITPSFLELFE